MLQRTLARKGIPPCCHLDIPEEWTGIARYLAPKFVPRTATGRQNSKWNSANSNADGVKRLGGGGGGDSLMTISTLCLAAVKKANFMLGIVRRGIKNKMANIVISLYTYGKATLGIPCLFVSSLPFSKKGKAELGKVQKTATQMTKRLEHLSYKARLKCLGLFSLEKRTVKGGIDKGMENYAW